MALRDNTYRTFLFQKICQQMKDKDMRHLLYTLELELTISDLEPTSVFIELEKRGMFSASNLKPLAKMMENINRKDLAKELEKFIKKQKPCAQVSKSSRQEASALGQITATLQSIQQVTTLLLDQLEGVKSIVPSDPQYSKVEREIMKAIAVVENNLQPKISLASRSLPQESIDSLDCASPTPSLSSSCSSQDKSSESMLIIICHCVDTFIHAGIKKRPLPPTPSDLELEENEYDVLANSQVLLYINSV